MPRWRTTALLTVLLLGCHDAHATAPTSDESGVTADPQALAAGFLVHERGLVRPHCHAVLTGPRVALAARGCLASTYPEALSFAVEGDPEYEIPVIGAMSPPDADTVALELDAALEHGAPAELGVMPRVGAIMSATSFVHVASTDAAPAPSRWTAEVIAAQGVRFVAELRDGVSGCHGDLGVAAFIDGRIVGVLVDVMGGGPTHPASEHCVTRFVFASVVPS